MKLRLMIFPLLVGGQFAGLPLPATAQLSLEAGQERANKAAASERNGHSSSAPAPEEELQGE